MNAQEIISISALVVTLVQLVKWAGLRESYGPLAVLGFSLLGVAASVFGGENWPPGRMDTIPILSGLIAVATSAAGVFGFTRAAVGAVTRATPPPASGAGSEPTAAPPEPVVRAYPEAPAHVVLHGSREGHVAFLTTAVPAPGAVPAEDQVFHVTDHRPYASDLPYKCDSCDEPLNHVAVVDGEWIATFKGTVPRG